MERLVSLLGVVAILAICFLFSRDRRAISWRLVVVGLLLQAALGFTFLYWHAGNQALQGFGQKVDAFLKLAQGGTEFVFGALASPQSVGQAFGAQKGFLFAFMVLPTLIFFSSFMAVLYHLGVMQWVVRGMAWAMVRVLGTSGSESLSGCANVFVGQTEAPLLVRPFLKTMTMSELHAIMVGGFATIAGGVFALYVGFGISAGHLMVASVMAVPAGLICSKLMWPETEQSQTMGKVGKIEAEAYGSVVEAAAAGAGDGLKLALNVGAMLIAFLGLVAVLNSALDWGGAMAGLEAGALSVQSILGWIFYPVAALMGVPAGEVQTLSQMLGTKLVLTELVAYSELSPLIKNRELAEGICQLAHLPRALAPDLAAQLGWKIVSPRTQLIASFALCGFANLGSVAIQIGGLGAMAPERRADLARIGLRAMFTGALATCMTACVAGILAEAPQ